MVRSYTKGKRAEQEAETRQRITEAALALHGEIGPSATTISMIAERAGVQRHTVYAHLPDERTVFMACSGLFDQRQPLPSPELWAEANDPETRLRTALTALYAWLSRNQDVTGHVLRDAEQNQTLREVSELRFNAPFGEIYQSLAEGLDAEGKAALTLAMSFYTWRTLRDAGVTAEAAVKLMTRTVLGTRR